MVECFMRLVKIIKKTFEFPDALIQLLIKALLKWDLVNNGATLLPLNGDWKNPNFHVYWPFNQP